MVMLRMLPLSWMVVCQGPRRIQGKCGVMMLVVALPKTNPLNSERSATHSLLETAQCSLEKEYFKLKAFLKYSSNHLNVFLWSQHKV